MIQKMERINNVGAVVAIGSGLVLIGYAVKMAVEWKNTSIAHKFIHIGEFIMAATVCTLGIKLSNQDLSAKI
jgi:hypothetical protein